jgi:hypothetical protein
MRSRVYPEGESTVIELPGPGFMSAQIIFVVISILIPTLLFVLFFLPLLRQIMPVMVHYAILGFFALFALLPTLLSLFRGLSRIFEKVRVSVSSQMLSRETAQLFKKEVAEIPASELEELTIVGTSSLPPVPSAPKSLSFLERLIPKQCIIATSDRCTLHFGEGLPQEELRYLHALILNVLTK